MAQSPVPSLVAKTKKPTPLQTVAMARAQQPQLPDPRIMDSRRTVNALGQTVGVGGKPIPVDNHGLVVSPSASVSALTAGREPLPNAPAKKPKVKIQIHPDGTISVTSHGHTQTTTGTPLANGGAHVGGPSGPDLAPTTPVGTFDPKHPGTNPGGAIDRVPTQTGPGGAKKPALSDFALAQQQAQLLLNPVVKQITDALNARSKTAQDSINSYTGELGRLFGLYSGTAGAGYDTALADQSAIDSALADRLNGVTSTATSDLSSKLSGNVDPATAARVAAEVSQFGTGAGKAGFALGSADLSRLVGERANASNYGAKLPGVAGLYGLAATKSQQAKDSQDLATALTNVQANAPSITESLLSGIRTDRNQRAQLAFEKSQFGAKTKAATAAATTKANTADATLSKTLGFLVNAQGDPILKGGQIVELPKSSSPRKANASLSKSLGYVVDAQGAPILRDGKKIVVPKASSSKVTPASRAKALGLARLGHRPGPNGEAPVTWQVYLNTGLSKGIPAEVLIEEGRKVYTQAEIHQGLVPGSK